MARCGCANGTTCNCVVKAGANVTVIGNGSSSSPYVVSAATATVAPLDTPTVDMVVTGGPAYVVSANVIPDNARALTNGPNGVGVCLSADIGNGIVFGSDGCIWAPTAAAVTVAPLDTVTIDTTVTGGPAFIVSSDVIISPDVGNTLVTHPNGLFVPAAAVSCAAVAACFTTLDTNSVNLSASGVFPLTADVIRDPEVGNILTIGPAGLDVNLTTGCGLLGDGTAASPLVVNAETLWPFPCPETNGLPIYCDTATGALVAEPEKFCVDQYTEATALGPNTNILTIGTPGGGIQPFGATLNVTINNPSPCRDLPVNVELGNAHVSVRSNNAGRVNFLVGNIFSAAGSNVIAPTPGNFHQGWLTDSNAAESDWGQDVPDLHFFQGIVVIPPSGSTTFSVRAFIQIINDQSPGGVEAVGFPGVVAQNGAPIVTFNQVIHFLHVTGCNA